MKKKYDKRTDEIIESSILSLEVLSIDDDGFSKAIIIDEKYLKQIVNIPFNNKNIKFSQKDHLLAQLNFVNEKFKVVKIIKKIEIEKSFFYAQVNLNSKNELILQELVRGRKSREIIIPIIPQGLSIKQGDVVKAQSASN